MARGVPAGSGMCTLRCAAREGVLPVVSLQASKSWLGRRPKLPAGVLALLLEAGDAQTVVVAGEEWLATHRRDPRARDVALSTALAHRTVAQVRACCRRPARLLAAAPS